MWKSECLRSCDWTNGLYYKQMHQNGIEVLTHTEFNRNSWKLLDAYENDKKQCVHGQKKRCAVWLWMEKCAFCAIPRADPQAGKMTEGGEKNRGTAQGLKEALQTSLRENVVYSQNHNATTNLIFLGAFFTKKWQKCCAWKHKFTPVLFPHNSEGIRPRVAKQSRGRPR